MCVSSISPRLNYFKKKCLWKGTSVPTMPLQRNKGTKEQSLPCHCKGFLIILCDNLLLCVGEDQLRHPYALHQTDHQRDIYVSKKIFDHLTCFSSPVNVFMLMFVFILWNFSRKSYLFKKMHCNVFFQEDILKCINCYVNVWTCFPDVLEYVNKSRSV